MSKKRTITAILVAPFASLAVVLGMGLESLFHDSRMLSIDGLVVFGLMAIVFVSTSFAFVLVFGVPAHILLSKVKISGGVLYIVLGVSVALAYAYLKAPENIPPAHLESGLWSYGVTAALVSLSFWYVAAKTHNK